MQIGKYKVIGRLGIGGMAEVFLATLGGIGGFQKTVVIKTILPDLVEDQKFVEMFLDEARVVANLSHPNIAQVYEIDEVDGRPFIAMEYVKGPTFGQIVRRAKKRKLLEIPCAAKVVSEVAMGLEHAHNAKDHLGNVLHIVHRDVSPHNIVISLDGVPKLLDFGVAKSRDKLVATRVGTVKGKLQYMPVEQLRGQDVDHRADVFALGVCLYRGTTGELPFQGDTEAAKVHALMEGRYPKPSEIRPDYPPELEEIIAWALERDRDARCPSSKALHDRLETFLTTEAPQLTTRTVGAWVRMLFPKFEEESHDKAVVSFALQSPTQASVGSDASGSMALSSGSNSAIDPSVGSDPSMVSSASRVSSPGTRSIVTTASRVGRGLGIMAAAILIAVVAGLGAVILVLKNLDVLGVETEIAPMSGAVDGPDVNSVASQYLEEAQRLAGEKQYRNALALLDQAAGAGATDPGINIKISRLRGELEIGGWLASARKSLALGEPRNAIESAKEVLDLSPSNKEALEVLTQARAMLAPPPSEAGNGSGDTVGKRDSRRGRKRAPAVKTGFLTVAVTPGGMVYVDDIPYGSAPLDREKLTAGTHRVEVRAAGFVAQTREVSVGAGKDAEVTFTLEKAEKAKPPPVEVAAATPSETRTGAKTGTKTGTKTAGKTGTASPPPTEPPPVETPPPPEETTVAEPPPREAPPVAEEFTPKLPNLVRVTSTEQLGKLFATIETYAVKGGAPQRVARGVTKSLEDELAAAMGSSATGGLGGGETGFARRSRLPTNRRSASAEVFPMAMYRVIVDQAAEGKSQGQISATLKGWHSSGRLRQIAMGR